MNATAENAEAFLNEIVGHYLRNEKLIAIYYQCFTRPPLDPLAAKTKSIVLSTRTRNYSEPSIATVGALGNLVFVLSPDGELLVVGTHWHFDDVYSFIINEINPQLPEDARYYIQRESCYSGDGSSPCFPHILPVPEPPHITERADLYT